ncbi:hypothetical protein YSY43_25150 [Paenibacillus sp. YSY-4.3]
MKSKRQTIWLVSMLSLMVILSAYYLFTEDTGMNKPKTTDGKQVTMMEQAAGDEAVVEGSALSDDDIVVSEVAAGEEAAKEDITGKDQAATNKEGADASRSMEANNSEAADNAQKSSQPQAADKDNASESVKDEDVLKKLESEGILTRDSLTAYQMDRAEQNMKKQEQLLQTMNDDKKTLDEATMAQQQLGALEEKEAKIMDIEERLQQQYANAVVTEDNDSYRVVVISEKLQVKEAVSIVDMVIKELGVSQDKVKVQYVSQ